MTTAGRPTFDPARGGTQRGEKNLSSLSKQYSSRDLPGHTKLKYRDATQQQQQTNRDLKRELEERERTNTSSKGSISSSTSSSVKRIKADDPVAEGVLPDDEDEDLNPNRGSNSEDEDEEDSDEDDTAELLAELNRIKKERSAEEAKTEAAKKAQEEKIRMENILTGNPLIAGSVVKTDFKVKRRWDDDVVFKNCARNQPDKSKPTFINDTLRSEFHKKFMDKYIH